ncbi:MAG: SRPBCC domain-containing protein [Gemmatimonadetes bacterium]|nr:SRPBCC domain-containing protein [Gemmatimonadota bacterium]
MADSPADSFRAECRRTIQAAPEAVFEAWSRPEALEAWMGSRETGGEGKPHLIAVRNVEIAPVAGAPLRIDMVTREPDGSERVWEHTGVVREAGPTRLSFTWISDGTRSRRMEPTCG